MQQKFEMFSTEHFTTLLVFAIFTFIAIWFGQQGNATTKKWIGFGIAMAAFVIMLMDSVYRLVWGIFDINGDLPLFLCDLVGWMLPLVIWKESRKWIGIFYFLALAGTMQALITPELDHGFPSFDYFKYFVMHAGIVSAVIYVVIVWKIKINWRDFFNAILYAQVYIVGIHIFNLVIGTNYSYTVRKPRTASILNFMGDWPWYLLAGEALMIILFLLLMIPYFFAKNQREDDTLAEDGFIRRKV